MLDWFRRKRSRRTVTRQHQLRARLADLAIKGMVDVARNDADTTNLFKSAADDWHVNSATRRDVRKKARYEFINNSYLHGMVRTKQVDLIGTGPRLHIINDDRESALEVERAFAQWMEDIEGPSKLRTVVAEHFLSGEGVALLVTNQKSPNPVKLDVRVLDAEQIADLTDSPNIVDGVEYDADGNVVAYHIYPTTPADLDKGMPDPKRIDVSKVCHWFQRDRALQVRGLSELTSALLPAALLRNFTLAVTKAANLAASLTFLASTDDVADDGESTACEPYEVIEIEHGTGMALPDGYKVTQLKPEQPVQTYGEFKGEMLNEVGRACLMPRLKVSGDASKYNYSSGRLDGQEYYHACEVERSEIVSRILNKWFAEWWQEAKTAPDFLSEGAKLLVKEGEYPAHPRHRWGWDGRPHVDPQKESTADETRLRSGQVGLHEIYAARGLNAEDELEKAARAFGLDIEEYKSRIMDGIFGPKKEEPGADSGEQTSEE